jgi:hypothetical protein
MSCIKIGASIFATLALAAFVWASESDELQDKARAMQREAAELAERGRGEEAEKLERKALAMLEEAEHLQRHRPDHRDAETREMRERLEVLRLEERELEEIGGKEERLGDVRREADRIERRLHGGDHDGHHEHDDSHEGIARRLESMRVAVEHLHHAGLHDIAEHVVERAEATERELHEQHRHREGDPIRAIMQQLEEIRHQVGRLRDEVNELRERR